MFKKIFAKLKNKNAYHEIEQSVEEKLYLARFRESQRRMSEIQNEIYRLREHWPRV